MTTGGWILMLGSLGIVWGLAIWCYRKVLSAPAKPEKVPPGFGP
jgi:hypothetical protein